MRDMTLKHIALPLLVILLAYTTVLGQETRSGWTPPQVLGDGWWQSINVDRQGVAHVGWYGGFNGSGPEDFTDALMYRARSFDGAWTPMNDVIVTGQGGWTVRNALVATSDGTLHAAFRAGTLHRFASAPISTASSASSWKLSGPISSTGYYIDMVADANDALHVVISGREADIENEPFSLESDPCPLCFDLYYRRSTDGGLSWTSPYNLSRDKDAGSDRPSIWVGASGRLYVSWDVGADWYVARGTPRGAALRYSNDAGLTWSEPIILQGGDDPEFRPIQIAVTELRDSSLMAVWRYSGNDDRQIYFQLSSDLGQTWTEPEPIEGITARSVSDASIDRYELLTDSLGIAHLFVAGYSGESAADSLPALYHLEYRQGQWATRELVFNSPEERPEWPQAAVGPQGDIHLTWFVRRACEGGSCTIGLRVYYSHRDGTLLNQPTQAFNPTRTPEPTPTLLVELEPTATPLPPVELLQSASVNTTRDTYAATVFVGGLMAVTVLCAGVIAIARFWRR